MAKDGSFTSSIGRLATISKPYISILYCSGSISNASSAVRGHLKFPFSMRLYKSRKPSPSQIRPRMRSVRLPQNRNNVFLSYGSRLNWNRIILARPSIPFLKSVKPHYPNVRIMWLILTMFLSSSFLDIEIFTHFLAKKMRITYFM